MTDSGARPLRIGIGAPYDLGRAGGVNSHIRAQAGALARRGHEVTVFGATSAPLGRGEVALGRCWTSIFGGTETGMGVDPRAWPRVARLLRAKRFDLLHLHEPLMPLVPWFVVLQADVPMVATFHTHREQGHRWYPRYGRLLEVFMRRIAVRVAVSAAAERTVATHFPGEYEIVPNGVDVARFRIPAARPSAMRPRRRHVLFVGRLEPRKGVADLIRAMALAHDRLPDTTLVIVGDGPDRADLERAAAGLNVVFAGRVDDDDLPSFYQGADVVCSPARGDESFGIVLLEAMAAGRPVVATRIDGYRELVGTSGSARLVPVNDPNALAAALISILENRDLAWRLVQNGSRLVAAYDWAAVAKRLEAIYARLASAAAPPLQAVC
jgi:phosphatidylinositol alpha-mannosyltransferase